MAEALFHAQGYDALGVAAICDAVGVRQPALYGAYGSKSGLFSLVLDRYAEGPYAAFVGAAMAPADTPRGALRAVLLAAAERYAESDDRRGCLALEAAVNASEAPARDAAAALVARTRAALVERYGALGAARPEAWADATLVAMRGLSAEARAGVSTEALRRSAELLGGRRRGGKASGGRREAERLPAT